MTLNEYENISADDFKKIYGKKSLRELKALYEKLYAKLNEAEK